MNTKICPCCKIEKPVDMFYKSSRRKDGLDFYCISCNREKVKRSKEKNLARRVAVSEKKCSCCGEIKPSEQFYIDNDKKDGLSTFCKSCKNHQNMEWRKNNKEKYDICGYKYREKNKDKKREYDKRYLEKKRETDEYYRLVKRITSCMRCLVIRKWKGSKYEKYLGCSVQYFREHLESLFQEGMNWENYGDHRNGGWSIDHIIPISKFDLMDEKQRYECFNYRNTQPLWWWQNQIKHVKVMNEQELENLRNTNPIV